MFCGTSLGLIFSKSLGENPMVVCRHMWTLIRVVLTESDSDVWDKCADAADYVCEARASSSA